MQLPAPTPLSDEAVRAIATRHGLRAERAAPLPSLGIINHVYAFGDDVVLRVPRNHPAHVEQAVREVAAIPAAIDAGVRTARLLAFDDSLDLLPVPYLLVERLPGVDMEALDVTPPEPRSAWRALGRDLALLHSCPPPAALARSVSWPDLHTDPRPIAEERAAEGWLSPLEARWLVRWLDALAHAVARRLPDRFVHADVQMANMLVDPPSREYVGLIDWGCAAGGDPAFDLLSMPMAAVPEVLAGHREVAPLDDDEGAEARIVWRRLQMTLAALPRGATPGRAWGERPVAWVADLLRFFADPPGERWRVVRPPAPFRR